MKVRIIAADGPVDIEFTDEEYMRMWAGVDPEVVEGMDAAIGEDA